MKKLLIVLLLIPQLAHADRSFYSAFSLVPGATATGDLVFPTNTTGIRKSNNGDALYISGGSAINSSATGPGLVLFGNTSGGSQGRLDLYGGNVSTGNVRLNAIHASSVIEFQSGSTNRWVINNAGQLVQDATNGGGIVLTRTGTTIAIDSGTAASACSGQVTANGATGVTTNTTCALTASRIFLSKQSASTAVNGSCTVTAIVNATSFTITCLATDTGTYNFWITQEG